MRMFIDGYVRMKARMLIDMPILLIVVSPSSLLDLLESRGVPGLTHTTHKRLRTKNAEKSNANAYWLKTFMTCTLRARRVYLHRRNNPVTPIESDTMALERIGSQSGSIRIKFKLN